MRAPPSIVALASLAAVASASLVAGAAVLGSRAEGARASDRTLARVPRATVSAPRGLAPAIMKKAVRVAWATDLPDVLVENRNTSATAPLRLYQPDGTIDEASMRAFMRIVATAGNDDETEPLSARLVQLVFRTAYHFGAKRVRVVSATRRGAHGKHGTGEAIDFAVDGVRAAALASWLRRSTALAGVGVYTHPRTQFVHLDVREQSFHWLDGSPPGVKWRERRMRDPKQADRDAAWTPEADLPEGALSP